MSASPMSASTEFVWWRDGVVYQIYPRSFMDSDGDGVGDLEGLISRLDYLAGAPDSLGVDALWLSPIAPSPGYDFGYDISDYDGIDPLFGSAESFDRLVEEAHKRGLRVILDLVMNHTSHLHPWFVEARSSRSHPKRDWYLWRDATRPGRAPNFWQAVFGGSAWQWDPVTSQYYYHMFLPQQPDLNWRNPAVVKAMTDLMKRWMDRGVDGFRLDVVNAYFKDEQLRDNPFKLGFRPYDMQRHQYDLDRPELAAIYQTLRATTDQYPDRMMVGEVMIPDPQKAARYCGTGRDQLHQTFNFAYLQLPWKASAFQQAILEWEGALHPDAWPAQVLNNHDIDRFVTRAGVDRWSDARARVAGCLLLTLRGTPYLYYGEELGLPNTSIPRAELVDPPGRRYWPFYKGRDPARTPMPWSPQPGGGFTSGQPWLRLNRDLAERNVETQLRDPASVLCTYRALLRVRKGSRALQRGSFQVLQREPKQVLSYLRVHDGQAVLVALNFSTCPARVKLDAELPTRVWEPLFSTHPLSPGRLVGNELELAPLEAALWEGQVESGALVVT